MFLGGKKETGPRRGVGTSSSNNVTKSDFSSSKLFLTQDIHFSQASVSTTFADGSLVSTLSQQLVNGAINVSEIPPIRVIFFQKKWLTLDNRRLRAFKDAMIDKTPVIVCDLRDPEISREFHGKRTNKTSDGGGVVRTFQPTGTTQHFDDGTYVFVKRILNLTLEQITQPLVGLQRKSSLSSNFYSSSEYYASFLELILEEARASLQAGIEASRSYENEIFELTFQDYKPPKKAENPAPLIFTKKMEERRVIKAYDAFLLESSDQPNVKLVALASYAPSEDSNRIQLKGVVEQDVYRQEASVFKPGVKWIAKPIGSLVTHLRMYDVCIACPSVSWLDQLLTGKLKSDFEFTEPSFISREYPFYLNGSQKEAIGRFLGLKQGIQLVQGPPGTGKTTTVVSMLALLTQQGRTLVCAPSNKAVQVLAERFVSAYPDIPAILAGVEDKLPENNMALRRIFVHTWGEQKLEEIACLKEQLWALLPNNIFVGTTDIIRKQIAFAIDQTKCIEEAFKILLKDFKKYGIEVPEHLDAFKQGMECYIGSMTENGQNLVEEKQNILKEDFLDPQKWDQNWNRFFNTIRTALSEITTFLSEFENSLRSKIADDSVNGLEGKLLNKSIIIFATLSVSGRKLLKEMLPVNALVIDEAGQALEAESLIPLVTHPEKCLLIGDTKQLSATVISTEAAKLKFDRSLMWRLLEDCQQEYCMLTTQYRMHPDIRHWPSQQYYDGKIQDSEDIALGKRVFISQKTPPFIAPYSFIQIDGRETNVGHSFTNREEVDAILHMMQYLQHQLHLNVSLQVGIITFYKAQAALIQAKVSKIFSGVKVNTVDSFQGDENDVIIISCVRSNIMGNMGFVNDFRRLNVALTRAKHGLMIMGNATTLERGERDLALLVRNAKERECFFNYEEIRQSLVPKPSFSAIKIKSKSKLSEFGAVSSIASTNKISREKKIEEKVICKFDYQKPGSCRDGAHCKFLHGVVSKPQTEVAPRTQAHSRKMYGSIKK